MIALHIAQGPTVGQGHAVRSNVLRAALERAGLAHHPIAIIDHPSVAADEVRQCKDELYLTIVLDDSYRGYEPPDIYVDANWHWLEHEWQPPWPHTTCLIGPHYAILADEYRMMPVREYAHDLKRIVITLGGADPKRATYKLLDSMRLTGGWQRWTWWVVTGPSFSDADTVRELAEQTLRVQVRQSPKSLKRLLWTADAVVCGGGMTLMEAARCGTPALCVEMGEDQTRGLQVLGRNSLVYCLGRPAQIDARHMFDLLENLEPVHLRRRQGQRLAKLVDGHGTMRIVEAVRELCRPRR